MSLALREMLEALTKMKIDLMINNNQSIMLNIIERRKKYARLSLHRMFLEASNSVVIALAELLLHKRSRKNNHLIRQFINESSEKYDSDYKLNLSKLETQGEFFDLQALYHKINRQYFDSKLQLYITWFGQKKRPKRQISFGLYHEPTKLIKINRLLDSKTTPSFFLEYIIYHEMLHETCRPILYPSGRRSVHTPLFKEKEKQFMEYPLAKEWEENYKQTFFR